MLVARRTSNINGGPEKSSAGVIANGPEQLAEFVRNEIYVVEQFKELARAGRSCLCKEIVATAEPVRIPEIASTPTTRSVESVEGGEQSAGILPPRIRFLILRQDG